MIVRRFNSYKSPLSSLSSTSTQHHIRHHERFFLIKANFRDRSSFVVKKTEVQRERDLPKVPPPISLLARTQMAIWSHWASVKTEIQEVKAELPSGFPCCVWVIGKNPWGPPPANGCRCYKNVARSALELHSSVGTDATQTAKDLLNQPLCLERNHAREEEIVLDFSPNTHQLCVLENTA